MTKQAKNVQNVVILHGWGSNPDRWEPIHKSLSKIKTTLGSKNSSKRLKVHVPFLPGFDQTKPLKKPFTMHDFGLWLQKYLKKNNIINPIIVGHSNGGRIAIYYTTHFDHDVQKLILFAAAGVPDTKRSLKRKVFKFVAKTGKKIVSMLGNKKLSTLAQKLLYKAARESDYLKASPVMKETMINVLTYDARVDLSNIKVPTLCIWGGNDRATPLWMGQEMHRQIKKSQLKIVEGGHNLHRTHPDELIQLMQDFI